MAYRKETYDVRLGGIDTFKSRLDVSIADGQNWWYTKEGNITQRPGSLRIDLNLPAGGYTGIGSFVPASPAVGGLAITYSSQFYTFQASIASGGNPLSYTVPTLVAIDKSGIAYRIRKFDAGAVSSGSNVSWQVQADVNGKYTLVVTTGSTRETVITNNFSTLSSAIATLSAPTFYGTAYLNSENQSPFSLVEKAPFNGSSVFSIYCTDPVPLCKAAHYGPVAGGYNTETLTLFPPNDFSNNTNVKCADFNGLLYMAGQNNPLSVYDGARASVAGAMVVINGDTYPGYSLDSSVAGSLTGTYTYKIRAKIYRPNGSVSYGRLLTLSPTAVTNKRFTFSFSAAGIAVNGSIIKRDSSLTYEYVIPRRSNIFRFGTNLGTTSVDQIGITYTDYNYQPSTSIQPGEVLFFDQAAGTTNKYVVNKITSTTTTPYLCELPKDPSVSFPTLSAGDVFTLGESLEIYRNTNGGSTWYYVNEIPYGMTYADNLSDASIVNNTLFTDLAYDAGPPPENTTCVAVHQNRLCVTCGIPVVLPNRYVVDGNSFVVDTLVWSQPNTDEFPETNSVIFTLTSDDRQLTAVFSQDDLLYVASEKSLWLLQGDLSSAESFSVQKLAAKTGVVSNTGFGAVNGRMLALGRNGVYELSGRSISEEIGHPVQDIIQKLPLDSLRRASVTVKSDLWILAIPGLGDIRTDVFSENKTQSIWLIWDDSRKCWYKWVNLPSSGVTVFDDFLWAVARDSTSGLTRLTELLPNDSGTAIDMKFKSHWQGIETAGQNKHFARLQVLATASESQNFDLTVKTEANWVENVFEQTAVLSFKTGLGYGQQAYATVPYGDANIPEQIMQLSAGKAKTMRVSFENAEVAQKPRISGWTIEISDNSENVKEV